MHNNFISERAILIFAVILLTVTSCTDAKKNYIIAVSQCSEDSWRQKLKQELEMATFFNEGVELRFASANDDSHIQERQIDSLLYSGADLLIVSPNQTDLLSDEIDKAYEAGIPVILFDRKTDSRKYTAFMGADNCQIGNMLGLFIADKLQGKGKIVEIIGLRGSSPAAERHEGFVSAISRFPGLEIVRCEYGDWTEESGETAMKQILSGYDGEVDAVFGGNDRMALGARRAMMQAGIDISNTLFVGVDALPEPDGGMGLVADSTLSASAIYPTHGDELMILALDILRGKEYPKETLLQSSIVTPENASILLLQHEEVIRQAGYLKTMNAQAGKMRDSLKLQQIILGLVLLFLAIFVFLLSFYARAYQQKKLLNAKLQYEMETVARQRDELEMERDKLIELSGDCQEESDHLSRRDSEFMQKFYSVLDKHLDNPDISVEDISAELCMSRAHLYRKVKSVTGLSPVEIIRRTRLEKADKLLSETGLNISEIAYRVGFSSASYFSKCYRDYFNRLPTDKK